MNQLLDALREKGIDSAEGAIVELYGRGVLTWYDASVYLAVDAFMKESVGKQNCTSIMRDIAHRYSISATVLHQRIAEAVRKSVPLGQSDSLASQAWGPTER